MDGDDGRRGKCADEVGLTEGEQFRMFRGDCVEVMRGLPDESVDLVLTDPPYNIGKADWDKISDYVAWSMTWLAECQRLLKPNGVLYFWHNDMRQLPGLMSAIDERLELAFVSFCVWDKSSNFYRQSWANQRDTNKAKLRQWFNVCEYAAHYFKVSKNGGAALRSSGLDRIHSDPACFRTLKDWYKSEMARLGLTVEDVERKYTETTGRKPFMVRRHYFSDSQFEIPTEAVWDSVFKPLGFGRDYAGISDEKKGLLAEYETLRASYEGMRHYHKVDAEHCNVWRAHAMNVAHKRHPCEKPVELLSRMVRVSCPPGGVVLDCFAGSGSAGEAALSEGRRFIGIERDEAYFNTALARVSAIQPRLPGVEAR